MKSNILNLSILGVILQSKGENQQHESSPLPFFPSSLSPIPYPLSPTPFDACYAGYTSHPYIVLPPGYNFSVQVYYSCSLQNEGSGKFFCYTSQDLPTQACFEIERECLVSCVKKKATPSRSKEL